MKVLHHLLLTLLLTSCGYFTDQYSSVKVDVISIENTDEGTLVTLSIDSDNDVLYSGVDYRRPGENFIPPNQGLLQSDNPEQTVLLTGVDDGPTVFRAFAATDDLYGYSEEFTFEVVSALPEVPCTIQDNFVGVNGASCQVVSSRIRTATAQRKFEIDLSCNNPDMKIAFPRDPTSGVYRTVGNIGDAATLEDKVVEINFISFNFFVVNPFQDVYVERTSDFTIITFCDLEYRNNDQFTTSGRVFVPR